MPTLGCQDTGMPRHWDADTGILGHRRWAWPRICRQLWLNDLLGASECVLPRWLKHLAQGHWDARIPYADPSPYGHGRVVVYCPASSVIVVRHRRRLSSSSSVIVVHHHRHHLIMIRSHFWAQDAVHSSSSSYSSSSCSSRSSSSSCSRSSRSDSRAAVLIVPNRSSCKQNQKPHEGEGVKGLRV